MSTLFDPELLRELLEGKENIEFKNEVCRILERDPVFQRGYDRPPMEEYRRINHERWKRLVEYQFIEDPLVDFEKFSVLSDILEVYDSGLSAKVALQVNVFTFTLASMGTARHHNLLRMAKKNQIVGCFCMTELGHGSNIMEMETTASFDNGEFVFNSPTDTAIKVWAGNLAHSATHAIVFAQLYISNKCYGVHAFVLQIRDIRTMKPLPGITIGDMGQKPSAWNGVENGWMEFKDHRAPLTCLLNRGCDVSVDGIYSSKHRSTGERQSSSLGTMSAGRIGIVGKSSLACALASTIAIRYGSVRKQFGREIGAEVPILDYPLHQHRLMPYLAAQFSIKLFHKKFLEHFHHYMVRILAGEKSEELVDMSKEIHSLSSSAKPVCTWLGTDALVEARRCCGGPGFLNSARLNEFRDNFEPSVTFEGENNIMLQQASGILLQKDVVGSSTIMNTWSFVNKPIPNFVYWSNDAPIQDILTAYKWLINRLIRTTETEAAKFENKFDARNHTQAYYAHPLSIAYAEHTIIDWSSQYVKEISDVSLKQVLTTACTLYAAYAIEKHLSSLYIAGYCDGPSFGEGVRSLRLSLEKTLAADAVLLVDAIAPPDVLLQSTLGMQDRNIYGHLMADFRSRTSHPDWLDDLSSFLQQRQSPSKL